METSLNVLSEKINDFKSLFFVLIFLSLLYFFLVLWYGLWENYEGFNILYSPFYIQKYFLIKQQWSFSLVRIIFAWKTLTIANVQSRSRQQ